MIKKQVITNKILIMMFLISFILVLTSVSSVSAASTAVSSVSAASTVYVNTTGNDDTGNGSAENPYLTIGKGISSVEENGTVKIANGNYKGTGNTNLTISRSMTITGQNQKKTIINGTGTNWIFNIINGVNVTIANLTLTNGTGYYFDGCGGAIYNQGNLIVENCTFTGNTASAGGAIFTDGNRYSVNITLRNCTFTGNRATWDGGAISSTIDGGSVTSTLTGCSFNSNVADRGGAIFNRGTLTANFNRFYNNTANDGSSAISSSEYDSVNAENNWWRTNNPLWENLIDGFNHPANWVILTVNAAPNNINNTKTSTITADFNHINGGGDLIGGHIPDGPVTLDIPWGSFTSSGITHSITLNTLAGAATALFYAEEGAVNPLFNPVKITATADNYTTNNTESAYITINKASDLYIKITSDKKNPKVGETFTLTYKLGNNGPDAASNVTITIPLPEGFEVSQITGDGKWTYNSATRTITWTLENVPVGDPYLYITGKVTKAGTYVFSSSISSETYNIDSEGVTPVTINTVSQVKAANKTIPLQKTGLPLNYLILAILMVLSGLVPRKKY